MKPKKKFWKEVLKAPKYILDVIDDGYKLPLMGNVKSSFSKNNASAFEHKEFVSETIRELLLDGSILEVTSTPDVVNPLSVNLGNSGKKRLILDS